ncbi:MAG: TIGR00266 family protein, partial [Planctomycetota bacterium]
MQHEILYRPSYSLLKVDLALGESICAESGAMVSMSGGVEIQTAARGGILGALKRSVLGGESFFMNTFNANEAGEVTFAPSLPGDIQAIELNGQSVYAQSGSYIASSPGI